MTTNVKIYRGELTAIPFSITDAANGLAGKRVTWSVARSVGGARLLRKVSALPGSSSEITIATQVAGSITGTINLTAADFDTLRGARYVATLWIDDGVGNERPVSVDGFDRLFISDDVPRTA